MRPQDLHPGARGLTCYDTSHNSRILLYYGFDSKSLHWIVNISLNLIEFFPQNKVPLL